MSSPASPSFVHLRLHSEYSIVDGIARIDDAVARAAKDGQPALALTDLANLFGMVKFYKAARGAGVKPVVGCDVWIENEAERDKPFRALLLVKNRVGYGRLCELLTRAYLSNKFRGRAELKREWFAGAGATEGLIALSGAMAGDVGQALLQRQCARRRTSWRGSGRAGFPMPTTSSCSAPGIRRPRTMCARPARWRAGSSCRWSPRIRCSSSTRASSARTRRASASRRATS